MQRESSKLRLNIENNLMTQFAYVRNKLATFTLKRNRNKFPSLLYFIMSYCQQK